MDRHAAISCVKDDIMIRTYAFLALLLTATASHRANRHHPDASSGGIRGHCGSPGPLPSISRRQSPKKSSTPTTQRRPRPIRPRRKLPPTSSLRSFPTANLKNFSMSGS